MTSPADLLGINAGTGNHFNVGIGRADAHIDYSLTKLVGGYSSDPEFTVTPDGGAVQFQVFTNGKTTSSKTKYPRSELRETNADGSLASWSGRDGCVFGAVSRVLHLPPKKPWACIGQIHTADSDLVRLQVEAGKLVVRNTPPGSDTEVVRTVRATYTWGDLIDWRFDVTGGRGTLFLDGVAAQTFAADTDGLYSKAGLYLQTNVKDLKESPTEYGLVEILRDTLVCRHGAPVPSPPTPVPDPPPAPVPTPVPVPSSATKIVLIRHAEKPSDKNSHDLSPTGYRRAQALVGLFLTVPIKAGLAKPERIFASKGKTASNRPVETAQPTAAALGLQTDSHWDAAHGTDAGKTIAKMAGNTLIVWAHTEIPLVVKGIASTGKISPTPPKAWSSSRFDLAWVFDKQPNGSWKFSQVTEGVLPGDKDYGISKVAGFVAAVKQAVGIGR